MKKILLVDDDPDFLKIIKYYLNQNGFEIVIAENAKEAYKKIQINKPDLILLDIMMPGMDGLEICRSLKSSEYYGNIPIIILSSKGQQEDINKGISIGANDYVVKPFNMDKLVSTIKKHLSDDKTKHWFIKT